MQPIGLLEKWIMSIWTPCWWWILNILCSYCVFILQIQRRFHSERGTWRLLQTEQTSARCPRRTQESTTVLVRPNERKYDNTEWIDAFDLLKKKEKAKGQIPDREENHSTGSESAKPWPLDCQGAMAKCLFIHRGVRFIVLSLKA